MASGTDAFDTYRSARNREDPVEHHLERALEASTDDDARYHLREALQLQIAEQVLE